MTIIKGLKDIEKLLDKPKQSAGSRVKWLKLDDGQSVRIRFLNEIDADSKTYDERLGLSIVVSEHSNPKDYRRKAVCTIEQEGRCFACEMYRKDPKSGWRARLRFYTNVIIDDGNNDPYVAVWSMGVSKAATFNTLREFAIEAGSLTNLNWKLKRNGKGTETNYVLIPGSKDETPFDFSGFEAYPLESAINAVPYADQEAFYMGFDNPTTSSSVDW
jgi:hypothetical protein